MDRRFIKSVLASFGSWPTTQLVDLTTSLPSWKRDVSLISSGNNRPIYTDEDMKMDLGKLTMAAFLKGISSSALTGASGSFFAR